MEGQCLQSPCSVYWSGRKRLTCQVPWKISGFGCTVPTSVGSWESSPGLQTPPTPLHPIGYSSFFHLCLAGSPLEQVSQSENNLQADRYLGTQPSALSQYNSPAVSLYSTPGQGLQPHLPPLTPSSMDKHGHPAASEAVPSSLSGPLRAPLTGVLVRRKQSHPRLPGTGEEKTHSFLTVLSKDILSLVSSTSTL